MKRCAHDFRVCLSLTNTKLTMMIELLHLHVSLQSFLSLPFSSSSLCSLFFLVRNRGIHRQLWVYVCDCLFVCVPMCVCICMSMSICVCNGYTIFCVCVCVHIWLFSQYFRQVEVIFKPLRPWVNQTYIHKRKYDWHSQYPAISCLGNMWTILYKHLYLKKCQFALLQEVVTSKE